MWMSSPPVQVSLVMVVLMMVVWSPVSVSVVSTFNSDEMPEEGEEPSKNQFEYSASAAYQSSRQSSVIKLEVVAIIGDSSNASLLLSKSLARTLNSITSAESEESPVGSSVSPDNNTNKIVTWRVKNFVIANYSVQQQVQKSSSNSNKKFSGARGSSDYYESDGGGGGYSASASSSHSRKDVIPKDAEPLENPIVFSPSVMPALCDFLSRSNKAVAIVNLIGDVGSERLLSLVSVSTALPLIGSSQYGNPLQTLHKDKEDFYINLSTSVRHFARALGHLLIHCHWHSFAVLFDDSPSILTSQLMWEQELRQMKTTTARDFHSDLSISNFSDYEYEDGGMTPFDEEVDEPVLNPNFITLRSRSPNSAFRALSELTKATQGVIALLCSQRSLIQVFRAAKQLRMLNGDYVFIIVGQYTQFEVIPDWVPSGVLALRSPGRAQIGKHTMKTTGKLLASALHTVKNQPIQRPSSEFSESAPKSNTNHRNNNNNNNHQNQLSGVFSGFSSTDFMGAIKSSSGSPQGTHHPHPFLSNLNPTTSTFASQNLKPTRPVVTFSSAKAQPQTTILDLLENLPNISCWQQTNGFTTRKFVSEALTGEIRKQMSLSSRPAPPVPMAFDILNLVRSGDNTEWHKVGNVLPETTQVQLETIRWPGGGIFGPGERPSKAYRVVTIVAPPFVMEVEAEDNRTCVKGLPCLKVNTTNKDEIALIFADFERRKSSGSSYRLACCDGLAMDLLSSVARELKFEIDLYLVPDGYFGSRSNGGHWNGLMSVLLSGAAHMSFAPFSVTSTRASAVDFSTPFFFSGVGLLGMSRERDVPLLAFLAPFSPELWVAIFITLNLTALVVALYEWFSPFGLNPWGRQRTKNFSMASALWVVWGRLFSHLVAFKAPKSWPNKFLINVWGGFSVIFVASYTANIAALFAGMFFERAVDVNDRSLLSQRVAAVKHSATDFYIKRENPHLWEHIQKFPVYSFQQGVDMLKNGSLDLLIGDGPLLDYYRGTDNSCSLIDVSDHDKIGDDTYAVAMAKGFPLKESISSLIAKYIGNGYIDYLQGKWYGQMACFVNSQQLGARIIYAGWFTFFQALGVDAVAGMFIMLGVGMIVGLLILLLELIVYKYALPYFRAQPRGTLWRSPNLMFFSQKLYRFINCVELVSPHHAAKELVNTLRHGQITSLFQKSVKRKEHEQRRRRKSKAQFFEMIQEIRRVQKAERQQSLQQEDSLDLDDSNSTIYSIQGRLESNKQMPKVVRVLGEHADIYQNKTASIAATALPTSPTILEVPEELFPDVDMLALPPPPPGYRNSPEEQPVVQGRSVKSSLADNKSKDKKSNAKKKIKFKKEPCSSTSLFSRRKSFEDPAAAEEGIAHRQYYHYRKKKQREKLRRRPDGSSDEIFDDDFEEEDLNLAIYGGDSTEESIGDTGDIREPDSMEQSNFSSMSKSQVIELWRSSEMDLRRQLAQALKDKERLVEKLEVVTKPEILDPP